MFLGCTQLSAAPIFVATQINKWSYANMFVKCFALSTEPTLPASYLSSHSYSNMFQNCISLSSVPYLYNSRNAPWMYNAMFEGCININPLSSFPYASISLNQATTSGTMSNMFRMCRNNINFAPRYDINNIRDKTLNFMYDRANSLNAIEVTFEQWPGNSTTSCWLKDVSPTGVFVCPSALDTSSRSYNTVPVNWNVLNY